MNAEQAQARAYAALDNLAAELETSSKPLEASPLDVGKLGPMSIKESDLHGTL